MLWNLAVSNELRVLFQSKVCLLQNPIAIIYFRFLLSLSFILPYNALWFKEFDTFKAFCFYSVRWNMKRPLRVGFIKNKKFFISKVKNMFLQIFLFCKNLSHITPTLWCAIKTLNVESFEVSKSLNQLLFEVNIKSHNIF